MCCSVLQYDAACSNASASYVQRYEKGPRHRQEGMSMCCSAWQYVAVSCSTIHCACILTASASSALRCETGPTDRKERMSMCCRVLQYVAVYCNVQQRACTITVSASSAQRYEKGVSMCCSVLQYVAASYSMLQCVAVCLHHHHFCLLRTESNHAKNPTHTTQQ